MFEHGRNCRRLRRGKRQRRGAIGDSRQSARVCHVRWVADDEDVVTEPAPAVRKGMQDTRARQITDGVRLSEQSVVERQKMKRQVMRRAVRYDQNAVKLR